MEDIIKAILPIIMLVIWVLSQVLGGNREQPAPRRPEPVGGGDEPEEKELREEIEKFLRQVAGEQQQQQQAKPQEAPWEAGERQRRQDQQEAQQRQERQRQEQRQRDIQQQRERQRQREQQRQRQRERERLQQQERERQFDRGPARPVEQPIRPATRSEEIILAEAAIAGLGTPQEQASATSMARLAHLESELLRRQQMAHDLVSVGEHVLREFGTSLTDSEAAHDQPHSVLAEILREPDEIRKAIILSEVLHRPVERW